MPMHSRLIATVYILALAFGFTGCAETKFVPPSPDVRQHLGKIAAVALPTQLSNNVEKPVSGAGGGALMGFGEGALGSLAAGMSSCVGGPASCGLGLVLGAAAAIVAAPIGAIVGAAKAHSNQEVQAADSYLRAALADIKPGEELSKRIAAATKLTTSHDMIAVPSTDGNENLSDLSAKGFGSVAETTITEFQLLSAGKIDPDVTLVIAAQVLLRRVPGGSDLYRRKWANIGVSHNYFDMAANDAALLRSEIQSGLDKLGDRIVTDLFTSNTPELKETSPRPGTVVTIEAPAL